MSRPDSSIYIPCLPLSQLLLYGCRYSGTSVDWCPPLIFLPPLLLLFSNLPSSSPSLILPRRTGGSGGEVTGRLAVSRETARASTSSATTGPTETFQHSESTIRRLFIDPYSQKKRYAIQSIAFFLSPPVLARRGFQQFKLAPLHLNGRHRSCLAAGTSYVPAFTMYVVSV
jgi:hypothetical protein